MATPTIERRGHVGDLGLSVLVGILLLIEFVMTPIEGLGKLDQASVNLLSGLGLGMGALLVVRLRVFQLATLLLMCASTAFNLNGGPDVTSARVAESVLHFALLVMLIAAVSGAVFAPGQINTHRILGSIAIYFLIALVFANAFTLIRDFNAQAFRFTTSWNALYFSFATMTTAGSGDVVAIDPIARSLANLESAFGQLYPATIIARLITLQIGQRS